MDSYHCGTHLRYPLVDALSTKIYHGFRFETTNLHEVLRVVRSFRPFIIREGEKLMDKFTLGYDQWLKLRNELRINRVRAAGIDTDFSLTFFPADGFLAGMAFTEHERWWEEWLKQPLVREWSYWNNTDPDEDVSETEWKERAKFWETIRIPSMMGFSIDVHDPQGPFPKGWTRDSIHKEEGMV